MKKRLMKIILWDHFCQVVYVLGTIPSIILWIKGHAGPLTGFGIGWNLGCAVYWQFYLAQRKRTDMWMQLAMKPSIDEMVGIAKSLVEARTRSAHIDPTSN